MKNLHVLDKKKETSLHKSSYLQKLPHNKEPDYSKSLFEITPEAYERIFAKLSFLYSKSVAETYMPCVERILKVYYAHKPQALIDGDKNFDRAERFTEKDVILITYGDLISGNEHSPLATLTKLCDSYLSAINTIHILPFFPYSSDKGFAVIDYETVDPNLGTWDDIEELNARYQLMFDGVINHVSSKSLWFQEFLNRHPIYKDFFITYDSPDDLTPEERKMIFRPRTSDILTEFQTCNGPTYVWTTFSQDQVDLNFKNPEVLLKIISVLLTYVRHGADIIRLDAVTYIWEEPGTQCIHLEQAHEIVKLLRDVLDVVAPRVALITETNVPREEKNISYFGNGHNEAQMVYNFALPPLVLYSFYAEDSTALSKWAINLEKVSNTATYFNFLDSHDGIGLMAVKNILSKEEIGIIIESAQKNGGYISYKTGEDEIEEPYEINIAWFSALNSEDGDEDIPFQIKRFVASRVIALVLQGVPGIYLHGLIGTRNDVESVLATGSKRDINRTTIDSTAFNKALENPLSKLSRINRELNRLITIRTQHRAFHPNGGQQIFMLSPHVFTVLRTSPEDDQNILTLTSVSNKVCKFEVPLHEVSIDETHWYDLVSGMEWMAENNKLYITMQPYDTIWLEPFSEIKNISS